MRRCLRATLAALVLLAATSPVLACKHVVLTRLTFAEGSSELEPMQLARLASFIHRANIAHDMGYLGVSIESGATVKLPGRTPAEATVLARRRLDSATRAYLQLQPRKLKLETGANIYEDNTMSKQASNDFVVVQFQVDYEASTFPDCAAAPVGHAAGNPREQP